MSETPCGLEGCEIVGEHRHALDRSTRDPYARPSPAELTTTSTYTTTDGRAELRAHYERSIDDRRVTVDVTLVAPVDVVTGPERDALATSLARAVGSIVESSEGAR